MVESVDKIISIHLKIWSSRYFNKLKNYSPFRVVQDYVHRCSTNDVQVEAQNGKLLFGVSRFWKKMRQFCFFTKNVCHFFFLLIYFHLFCIQNSELWIHLKSFKEQPKLKFFFIFYSNISFWRSQKHLIWETIKLKRNKVCICVSFYHNLDSKTLLFYISE